MDDQRVQIKLAPSVKAFINYNGKILLIRESEKYKTGSNIGKYDVVGGKVEAGQRFDQSLLREIKEEVGLENIKIGRPFFVNEWRPVVREVNWQIIGTFFECFADSDRLVLSADYDNYKWIDPKDYKQFNLIENLVPAFESYLEFKKVIC